MKAKIAEKDNGYFMVWELPCGHRVRVTTEYLQWSLRYTRGARTAFHAQTRERLSDPEACPTCRREAMSDADRLDFDRQQESRQD